MKKYCCPQLGACQKATAGEIFEREPGAELKCPECGHLLELHFSESSGSSPRKPASLIAAGAALAVLIAGSAGWALMNKEATENQAGQESSTVAPPASNAAASIPQAIAPSVNETAQHKADGQAKLGVGDGAGAESASAKAASNEMVKLGIAQMAQNKLEEAEKSFSASVATDPKQSLGYYNMGILRLRQGRTDDALKAFEASFMAGFSYFEQLDQDRDLDSIKKDPRFADMLKRYRGSDNQVSQATNQK